MSTTQTSFIELLRATTKSEHRALERTPLMASLMHKDLSVAGYAQVLLAFARFYATLDPLLSAVSDRASWLPHNYRYQARLPYLERDLDVLRNDLNQPLPWQAATLTELFTTPQDQSLLNSAEKHWLTDEQLLGFIYVIEGSSQGGKIIAPRIAKQLKLTEHAGLSFFSHFAFQATAWPALRQMLTTLPGDGVFRSQSEQVTFNPEQVCDAARTLFHGLAELTAPPQIVPAQQCVVNK